VSITPVTAPVKVAVVGAGSMGSNHLRVLAEMPEPQVHLVGVAEPYEPALARATSRFHIPGFTNYRDLIAETQPDLVSVVVPTHLHFEVAAHALSSGCSVLIEKPITTTVEEAKSLIAIASTRGVRIAVGHVERFNPAVIALKQLLDSGGLGKVYHVNARRLGPFPPRIRDVGVILDLATHDLDVMRYLTGSEIVRVVAESQQRIHQSHEDMIIGLLRFANDVVGVLDVNWLTPTKVRELSVTGERGMYLVNYLTQDLYFYENDYTATNWDALRSISGVSEGTMTRLKVTKGEPLRLEYESVLKSLVDGGPMTVSGEDGLAVLASAIEIRAAAHAKEEVAWAAKRM
jgi:UDP-N-acetylglucosamine 3-dehydrogenase